MATLSTEEVGDLKQLFLFVNKRIGTAAVKLHGPCGYCIVV